MKDDKFVWENLEAPDKNFYYNEPIDLPIPEPSKPKTKRLRRTDPNYVRQVTPSRIEKNKNNLRLLDLYNELYPIKYNQEIYQKICWQIQSLGCGDRLLLLMPRETHKTSIVSVAYTIYLLAQNPDETILIYSETEDLAKSIVWEIKNKLESCEWLHKKFPYLIPQKKTTNIGTYSIGWRQNELRLPNCLSRTPNVYASGLDQSITGHHFSTIICDDIVSPDNTVYLRQIEATKRKFRLLHPLLKKNIGKLCVVGTRWAYNDLYADLLKRTDYRKIVYSCYDKQGETIFPGLGEEYLEQLKRDMSPYLFACNYLNEPIADETALFKKDYFAIKWDYIPQNVFYFTACDPASTNEKGSDYTAIVTIAVDTQDKIYVVDRDRLKTNSATEIAETFIYHIKKYKPLWYGIEKRGFNFLIQETERLMEKQGIVGKVIELKDEGKSKFQRIAQLEPFARRNDLLLASNMADVEMEFLHYPRGHDDLLDALAYAVSMRIAPDSLGLDNETTNYSYAMRKYNKIFHPETECYYVGHQYDKLGVN